MRRRDLLKLAAVAPAASAVRECGKRREELAGTEPREPDPDIRPTEPFPAIFLPRFTDRGHHG